MCVTFVFLFLSDVDECKDPKACEMGKCVNTPGNYTCTCPKGYRNTADLKECISASKNTSLKVSLGMHYALLLTY